MKKKLSKIYRRAIGEAPVQVRRRHLKSGAKGGHGARLAVPLFFATVFTTMMAGAIYEGVLLYEDPWGIVEGIPFSASLLFILGTHEFAHYFASRVHRVPSTLPFFIPAPPVPFVIGTFGAVIKMRAPIATKRALIDIGASGPLAGFIAAVIVTLIGLKSSMIIPIDYGPGEISLGTSLIFEFLIEIVLGYVPKGFEVYLSSVAFAGWIGFLVTALNLLPIGQLDGGHIVYALNGRVHRKVSLYMVASLFILGTVGLLTGWGWIGWMIWAVLVSLLGIWHPPVVDEDMPLGRARTIIGIVTLLVFILTFMPLPFYIN